MNELFGDVRRMLPALRLDPNSNGITTNTVHFITDKKGTSVYHVDQNMGQTLNKYI